LARLIYSRRAFRDLDRLTQFLDDDPVVIDLIAGAVDILAHHPQIGRRVEHDMRELVISRGRTGYVALYDFDPDDDVVIILAIRHQCEAGYEDY
jgi:plasmid stabilization system protein ParE